MRKFLSGNEAFAEGVRLARPQVISAYPITPQTTVVEALASMVEDGSLACEYLHVESEHTALSAAIGASATGARTFTATSSQGLLYMAECLTYASGGRFPIVMMNANRALALPWNIYGDQRDSLSLLDHGWIQVYAENNQEAYDNYLMAHRIGETPDVRLPVMICEDGFITSHALENIELEEDEAVKAFVGEYHPENYLLKHENPLAVGPYGTSPYYMEARVAQAEAMKNAKRAILDVAADFEKTFGRKYGFFEAYRMEDAELAIVLMGSSAGTAKAAVDELRESGVKAGLIKIRVFRPFPGEELAEALKNCKAVAVLDKSEGFSACGGPLFAETASACINLTQRPKMVDIVYGLGGRDFTVTQAKRVFARLEKIVSTGEVGPLYSHMGQRDLREDVQ